MLEIIISHIWLWTIWLWVDFDTQTSGGYSLVFWYPDQWGLFIDTLISKPMEVIHWYSDTQTNGDCSLILWYPNQWGLFIGILIPKPMGVIHWYSDTQPMGVIHWYSNVQSQGYNVAIVIRLLRIWITFEYLNILSPQNYICDFGNVWVFELFWVTKTAYVFLEPIVSYSFWYMENWLFSKPSMIYVED